MDLTWGHIKSNTCLIELRVHKLYSSFLNLRFLLTSHYSYCQFLKQRMEI
uniref:Uncharacterized protein n=1 Tax=Rhizophora mucronata TaxID=61149 RepID=A0A2P2PZ86_RHIMU